MKNEKFENPSIEQGGLIDKAHKLQRLKSGFWVRRNIKNIETGEKKPGKLESSWYILNISPEGTVTLFNGQNEILDIPVMELARINQDLFNLDT